jgi:predicted SprT family Zn-dependent metalloprotease
LIVESVKHEIAHALVGPGHGHGEVWQRQAAELGIPPVRCALAAKMPLGKWNASCPTCAKFFSLYRKPKHLDVRRWCMQCGPIRGQLTFTANLEY